MPLNVPNILTLFRIVLIPVLVGVYLAPIAGVNVITTVIFITAAVTDWLDGFLARRLNQNSAFGAFLDPVADKLIVATALVLLATDPWIMEHVIHGSVFAVATAIIIGREIAISALREWMAEIGKRASVAVTVVSKFKTVMQMVAIGMLLYREEYFGIPMFSMGEWLLYVAAGLTAWTMVEYLRAAWPSLTGRDS